MKSGQIRSFFWSVFSCIRTLFTQWMDEEKGQGCGWFPPRYIWIINKGIKMNKPCVFWKTLIMNLFIFIIFFFILLSFQIFEKYLNYLCKFMMIFWQNWVKFWITGQVNRHLLKKNYKLVNIPFFEKFCKICKS